jgi:hypothetical protein
MQFRVSTLAAVIAGCAGVVGCEGCPPDEPDAGVPDVPLQSGTFTLAWTSHDQTSGKQISCDKLDPNAKILVKAARTGTGGIEQLTCKTNQGTSVAKFVTGEYAFTYELRVTINGALKTLATAAPETKVIVAPDTVLKDIDFQVNASGHFDFKLLAGAGGNCSMTGAEISGMSITLEQIDDAGNHICQPTTFTLSDGRTYNSSNCMFPSAFGCIKEDVVVSAAPAFTPPATAQPLPSGPYQIHIIGKRNTSDCWSNNDIIRVPPDGATPTPTPVLNLALASENPNCQ